MYLCNEGKADLKRSTIHIIMLGNEVSEFKVLRTEWLSPEK